MIKFLKKLFSFEEEEQAKGEEIKVEDLEEWFNKESGKTFSELDSQVRVIKDRVKGEILSTKDNLAILGTAKLHNPKISIRETQFMEGNRKAYILAVNTFLRGVDLEREGYSSLMEFCDDFSINLDKFGKSTARTYHILQEFFAHESRNIAINVKNIGSSVGELNKAIADANIGKIDEIKGEIAELKKKIEYRNEIQALLSDKDNVKESLIRNKNSIEKEIEMLLKSKEFKHLNELKANKEAASASIREHDAKIIHAFSVMEKPLKKLARVVIEESELLDGYMEDPVGSLANDNEMNIVALLKGLEKNINNLSLELKDKKREKVLETVKGLTEEFLREFVNKHNELNKRLKDLEKEIRENEAFKKNNKLNYERSNVIDNLEKVNSEILSNEQELSKIDIGMMKNNLSDKVNELLKMDVVIS